MKQLNRIARDLYVLDGIKCPKRLTNEMTRIVAALGVEVDASAIDETISRVVEWVRG